MVGSAAFFTIYFGFPNIRYFGKAINTVRGKYDDIDKPENIADIPETIKAEGEGEVRGCED